MEIHKIVMFVVFDKFSSHHYEHVTCPDEYTT